MEEYTQITLDEWTSWKEDIRRKLAETAGNFVYIGYRLKQIRDSGMYDGASDRRNTDSVRAPFPDLSQSMRNTPREGTPWS